jgi:MOSC domain-containing protein YiiM
MSATLAGIARRGQPRAPMETLGQARIGYETGIAGDCRGATPDRNVTLLFREDWEAACRDLGRDLPWTTRRANLLVEGLRDFKRVGVQLGVGDVLLEVTEENGPCGVMDILSPGLRAALAADWRGGVACRVLQDGVVVLGDRVSLVKP